MATSPSSNGFSLPPLSRPPSAPSSQPLPGLSELDASSTARATYASDAASTSSASSFAPPRSSFGGGLGMSPIPSHDSAAASSASSVADVRVPSPLPPIGSPFPSAAAAAPAPSASPAPNPAPAPESSTPPLPDIGQIRCYWTLLSPRLELIFLDPILTAHMGPWAEKLVGTSLLDWVHPDEREQLREDLMPREEEVAGVEVAGVFGSVTRCRYSRVVRLLRDLGCQRPPQPPDAKIYAIDDEYLTLDLTTSWIAGDRKGKGKGTGLNGAVLAFFHATKDVNPDRDNDAQHRTGWTNWCGPALDSTSYLTPPQCDELLSALERVSPHSASPSPGEGSAEGPPAHVFQILDSSGQALVTFPRSEDSAGGSGGKSYDVEQFAALAREVMERPREAVASKTSCMRRYRSKHPVMKDGTLATIESVVIRYGAITFACFQTGGVYLSAARKANLSLVTTGDALSASASASDFALEDVPTTPTVAAALGNSASKRESPSSNDTAQLHPHLSPPQVKVDGEHEAEGDMSPPAKRFKPSPQPVLPKLQPIAPTPPLPAATSEQPQLNGLSIMTGGRLFRNTLDVEAITAGGISPTVASASAILGSFSADAHQNPQNLQPQPPAPPPQQYSPHPPVHSPSSTNGTSSYAAFYNSQPPLQHAAEQSHSTFAAFNPPPQITYSQPQPSPASYAYSPHPLSQSHSSSYFSAAPLSPHDSGPYPPLPGGMPGQPFPTPPLGDGGEYHHHSHPPPPEISPAPPQPIQLDLSQIAVPPPPPPTSGSGKKPPKQRPDGPVYKPNTKACESCGTANSPEWRKGPTGAKSLCNACGLRYARSVARQKKQAEAAANGTAVAKGKKKKKGAAAQNEPHLTSSSLPPHSAPPPSPSLAGAYDLSAYGIRASPKPYTPYYTTAPNAPGSYAHAPSPTTSQAPVHPFGSAPPVSSTAYFPSMYSAAPPFSSASAPFPISTHTPLPPVSVPGGFDYSRPPLYSHPSSHFPPPPHLAAAAPHLDHSAHAPSANSSNGGQHSFFPPSVPSSAPPSATGSQMPSPHVAHAQPSYGAYDWRHEQADAGMPHGGGDAQR
ncbi:hypothetical protein JCM10213_005641 [Rhodosporidiobolus nylandii]